MVSWTHSCSTPTACASHPHAEDVHSALPLSTLSDLMVTSSPCSEVPEMTVEAVQVLMALQKRLTADEQLNLEQLRFRSLNARGPRMDSDSIGETVSDGLKRWIEFRKKSMELLRCLFVCVFFGSNPPFHGQLMEFRIRQFVFCFAKFIKASVQKNSSMFLVSFGISWASQ